MKSIEGMYTREQMEDGWVKVEDELPKEEEWVLIYNNLE